MEINALYIFFTGLIYVSWMWDSEDPIWCKVLIIILGFVLGWLITPFLIGKVIRKIY